MIQHPPLPVFHGKLHRKISIGVAGRNLMAGSRIDQRERESDPVARLGRSVIGTDLYSHRPLHHIGIVPAAPEVSASTPDRTIRRHWPIDFRHMAALANETPLLHEELAFVFRIRPARSHVIK